MNTTQWLIACGFLSWVSFQIGGRYALLIATKLVQEYTNKRVKDLEELNAKFDKLTELRRDCDRMRFENQTRANPN